MFVDTAANCTAETALRQAIPGKKQLLSKHKIWHTGSVVPPVGTSRPPPSLTAMPAPCSTRQGLLRTAFVAALVGVAGVGGAVAAEPALPSLAAAAQDDAEQRVLPVWNNESGRVEALLLLDTPAHQQLTPLDRLLSTRPSPGIGVRLQAGGGSTAQTALQFDPDAGMALLCNGSVGLAASLGTLGEDCLLASLGESDVLLRATSPGLRFGGGWQSAGGSVDLSFGLSWLDSSLAEPLVDEIDGFGALGAAGWTGSSVLSRLVGAQLEAQQLQLGAQFNLSGQRRLTLSGSLASQQFTPAGGGMPLHWDSATVTFGVGYRGITGQLTGRLLELPDQGTSWSGLDLGVSWRTPWRADISVGARNVIGSGTSDPGKWPLAELPAMEDPTARVPYVRYRQDL